MFEEALQIAEKRREMNSKEREEGLLQLAMQRNRGKQNGKDLRCFQENWRHQGNISYKDGHDKGQKQQGPKRNRRN